MTTILTMKPTDSPNVSNGLEQPTMPGPTDPTEATEALVTLQARLIDAGEGNAEGARHANDPTMTGVFQELRAMHAIHASALSAALMSSGVEPDADGSFLHYLHNAVIVHSTIGDLGETAMPGVLENEERILSLYDDTLKLAHDDAEVIALLKPQRLEVRDAIHWLHQLEAAVGSPPPRPNSLANRCSHTCRVSA